jgi:heptosyltransferase-2
VNSGEKVLVVGPAWVGDMVIAQSLFKLLTSRGAGRIDVVAPGWSGPLLERMPEVRTAVAMPIGHGDLGLAVRRRIGRSLRSVGYDRAIVLPRSWKSALVPFFADIPERTGFDTELRYGLLNDRRELDREVLDQTVKRFLSLGLPRGATLPTPPEPSLEIRPERFAELAGQFELRCPAVALMPGAAYGPAKCWPLEHYAELAAAILASGRQVWVLGSAADRAAGEKIVAAAAGTINLCGETQLVDTVDLLAACDAAVSNDSGLMHVAAAAGTRVVGIYGSSSPNYTPPLTDQREIIYLGLDCSPCFKRECPLGHLRCLREISAARVAAALQLDRP